ncbi:hypothetical protein AB4430_20830, partial [Vibrio kanaloae]|uniref:hypothetical protein n=1 Tax=Vibrio kanaloae TaxID=170673 RepID=UPI00354E94FD
IRFSPIGVCAHFSEKSNVSRQPFIYKGWRLWHVFFLSPLKYEHMTKLLGDHNSCKVKLWDLAQAVSLR